MFGGEESWAESFKLLEPSMESDFIELTSEFVDSWRVLPEGRFEGGRKLWRLRAQVLRTIIHNKNAYILTTTLLHRHCKFTTTTLH